MSFSDDLIQHAIRLLGNSPGAVPGGVRSVDLRRAVSAAYYALFHHLSEATVDQIAPYARSQTRKRVHRWLNHGEMKKICKEFTAAPLKQNLHDLLDGEASEEMQRVALSFIRMQEARHNADYALDYLLSYEQALELVELAVRAMGAWEKIKNSAEANIFILSMLLWKNWEKERV